MSYLILLFYSYIYRFEELYNIRIAYKAFEGNDMRGMMLEERTMLSALKVHIVFGVKFFFIPTGGG